MMKPLLSFEHISCYFSTSFGELQAVRDVSLDLYEGEIFGLIGETGSGKSVLGLTALQLLPANARVTGEVRFENKSLLQLSEKEMRHVRGKKIALIPQNPASSLNPVLKIRTQLREAVRHQKELKDKDGYLASWLQAVSFSYPIKLLQSYPFQLSGGMKQRILTIMGAAGQPKLLIADEPTKGLDAPARHDVVEALRNVCRQTGTTLLVITHDLHVAQILCDRIGVMYAGRLVESNDTDSLFATSGHPYTEALLLARPTAGMKPMAGDSPNLLQVPSGCAFHPRCSYASEMCVEQLPPWTEYGQKKYARCFLHAPST
ncbi:ABC transporter ATP-binding protein [Aneurinibacillus aneurinilyticus]|uniref:ABC transporter ATP-binding protein n=1 Tax=Aneurinibacillus aneurinilyticus TaxID=1391 RepID=UPI0036730B0E